MAHVISNWPSAGFFRRRSPRWTAGLTLTATVALALCPAASGAPAKVSPLRLVSGASPLPATCLESAPESERGVEIEPSLAVDPNRPRSLVAAWPQDRARGIIAASSRNGGGSWREAVVPASICTGGDYERAGAETQVSIGAEGTAYLATVPGPGLLGFPAPAVSLNRSTDGGRSWSGPIYPHRETPSPEALFDDKETVSADPFRAGAAYVVWSQARLAVTPSGTSFPRDLYLSQTGDGGFTWSAPVRIYEALPNEIVLDSDLIVSGGGHLVCVFSTVETTVDPFDVVPGGRIAFLAINSDDGGQSWSSPAPIGESRYITLADPDGTELRVIMGFLSAEGGRDGSVHVTWEDHPSSQSSRILLSSSQDGRSWTEPRLVSGGASSPFVPDLAVTGDGTVGVRFYDLRNDRPGDAALTTDSWFRHSHDSGLNWEEARLGDSFDLRTAPLLTIIGGRPTQAPYLGDYQGLVAVDGGFAALFARAQPAARDGKTDLFFARIGL